VTARPASLSDAQRFLSLLAKPGDVFELRSLSKVNGQQHVDAGYFDDMGELARAAVERSGRADGVYITINPVHPGLLSRAPRNRVQRAGNQGTTSDREVRTRRSILVDIDPVRPTGISSTEQEHAQALALAARIRDDLSSQGWPLPILADSGNGGHLIYAVDLPVDDGGLVSRVLKSLSAKYSTAECKVDEKMFNPARISKIYGTLTRKGENTQERPHRVARIVDAPTELVPVDRAQLEALAPVAAAPRANGTNGHSYERRDGRPTFDATIWISANLPDAKERAWAEGRKWILPVCPFNDSHSRGEAYVVQMHSGAMDAGCLHDSCVWGWKDLRAKFEPDAYERRTPSASREVLYEDPRYQREISETEAEYERIAEQDRDPPKKPQPLWYRLPSLVDAILERAGDPWIDLTLAGDEIARARAGATVVLVGGSGSGKSSLTSCLLIEHARNVGPAIALSIELPADELAARIVGIRCDASWEDGLRGRVPREHMQHALDIPRMYVLDRRRATIANLEKCIDSARLEYPNEPILVAIDYTQLLDSKEREVRMRVADALAQIDDCAREKRVVALALSQMSRANETKARQGEVIGADSASLGAESAAIERFATVTLSIGMKGEAREDGSQGVELSVGKSRMGQGDRVIPMTYWGRTGKWRVAGEAKEAHLVRGERDQERERQTRATVELAMVAAAQEARAPITRQQLLDAVAGVKLRKAAKTAILTSLITQKRLVEVDRKQLRSKYWLIWTPDRVDATPDVQVRSSFTTAGDGEE
jgi:hypothetical protein